MIRLYVITKGRLSLKLMTFFNHRYKLGTTEKAISVLFCRQVRNRNNLRKLKPLTDLLFILEK
jgi:hypothetical protein